MNKEVILSAHCEAVFDLRINRVHRMNALGVETVKDLRSSVREASSKGARVLLIRGTDQVFCAGADLKERKAMSQVQRIAHNAAINEVFNEIASLPFVTIAVINGLALGGGLELALCCDLRFGATTANLGLTESRIGIIPGAGGTQRLSRLVGKSRALQIMLSAEPVTSEYAAYIGLVNEVLPDGDLDTRVIEYAKLLSTRSPRAQSEIKRLVSEGLDLPLPQALALERSALPAILESPDYAEGLLAFEEKRPPRFSFIAR